MRTPNHRMPTALAVLTLLGGLGFAHDAAATIVVPHSLTEMSTEAALVVRGYVVQSQGAWDDAHRRIHTYTEIHVEEVIHGPADATGSIVVRTMGGIVGDIGMNVAGVARFVSGEEVVLFLRVDPMKATQYQVIGMSQGKYTVDRTAEVPTAVAHTGGLAFARRTQEGKMEVGHDAAPGVAPSSLPLSELVARVKVAVGAVPSATPPAVPTLPQPPTTPETVPGQ